MPKGPSLADIAPYILLVVAVVVIGGAAWSTGASNASRRLAEAHEARIEQVKNEVAASCPGEASSESCRPDAVSALERATAEADLAVQKEMATTAYSSLLAALALGGLSLLVSAFGIFWVKETLIATRKSADATLLAVAEARRTNAIAAQTFVTEQRPWIAVELEVRGIEVVPGKISVHFTYALRNAGKSPAFVESVDVGAQFEPFQGRWNSDRPPFGTLLGVVFVDRPMIVSATFTQTEPHEPDIGGLLDMTFHVRYKMNGAANAFETKAHFRIVWDQTGPIAKRCVGIYEVGFQTMQIFPSDGMT